MDMTQKYLEAPPKVELNEASLLLLKAADLIEERGHCKFTVCDPLGRVCLLGALNFIDHGAESGFTAVSGILSDAFNRIQNMVSKDPVQWNNDPERTAEEVISTLRLVALEEVRHGSE